MSGRSQQRSPRWTAYLCLISALCLLISPAAMVKEHDFKKSHQSGFCKRNRAYADHALAESASGTWEAPYAIEETRVSLKDGRFTSTILKTIDEHGTTVNLPLTISFLQSGTVRVTVDEERRQQKNIELRHDSKARQERYNEAERWAIVGGLTPDKSAKILRKSKAGMTIQYGPNGAFEADIKYKPFGVDFRRDGATHIKLNDRGLINVEHWRPKFDKGESVKKEETASKDGEEGTEEKGQEDRDKEEKEKEEKSQVPAHLDESTWWDESFGGNTDSKPRGPESIALDISFPGYEHVYGIPEHTGPLSLKQTRGGEGNFDEPYRLYNADVFEYILDSPMTLYGSIPFMQAQRADSTVGVFWLNGAETWIDIVKSRHSKNLLSLGGTARTDTHTHWISESGLLDVFVFLGPTPRDVSKSYGELTGTTTLPAEFALGYHQCRWNYVSDDDVKEVDRKMDKFKIPYDVIWLDIEYTHEKKYFTWDPDMFKDPIAMGKQLDEHGRKLVLIIDPHIKNVDSYPVISEMKTKGLAVKNKEGNDFDGWCWPGSSMWIDCFNPGAIEWWRSLFKYESFAGTMENTYVWNDMNEPSVFNGPEVTMAKDNLHHDNWEHRDVHNINGMTFHNATYEALLSRKKGEQKRPFVLTRSFFAGSQRLGAMWTGDNQASWEHLGAAVPMLLAQGISGFPFAGADVGGFFGNPELDLQSRWYQAGAFYPFFRGHAHIDARRREPYLAPEPHRSIITSALRLRYSLMPSWYTAFFHASQDGSPIIRPMFWTHPGDEGGFDVDDQFFVGSTGLLVKPVVEKDKFSADVYIPDHEIYYDYFSYAKLPTTKGKRLTVDAPLEYIPVLMRGGHIFARRDTPRRSTKLMRFDDYTLVVVLGKDGVADGELYVDDGESFDHQKGQFVHRAFKLQDQVLTSKPASTFGKKAGHDGEWLKSFGAVGIDQIILVGVPADWSSKKSVKVKTGGKEAVVSVEFNAAKGERAAFAIVRLSSTDVKIVNDWEISFV